MVASWEECKEINCCGNYSKRTTKAIQLLIKKRFQIDIKRRTLCNYLKAWGFGVQRPAKRAIQQVPKAVADWLENQYPAIERKAKSENVLIYSRL